MNKARFRATATKYKRPTDYVDAPALAGVFFDEGEPARFTVRGLDANELFLARQRREENSPARAMVKALQDSGQIKESIAAAMASIFGDPKVATAAATAYSTELIVMGTVDEGGKAILDYEDVAILGEHHPAIYLEMSNKIQKLSGESSIIAGEPQGRSGKMIASGAPSISVKQEGNSSSKPSQTSSLTNGLPMSS